MPSPSEADQTARRSHRRQRVAREDERGRVRLLDHGRPGDDGAGRRARRGGRSGSRPAARRRTRPGGSSARAEPPRARDGTGARRVAADRGHPQVDQLDRLARQARSRTGARARRSVEQLVPQRRPSSPSASTGPRARSSGPRSAVEPKRATTALAGVDARAQVRRPRRGQPLDAPRAGRARRASPSGRSRSARGRPAPAAIAAPNAEQRPGCGGTRTVAIPSRSATARACSGPAPPKAISAKSRGSSPRSTAISRIALAMFSSAVRSAASAAARASSPSVVAERRVRADALRRGRAPSRPPRK